MGRNEIELQAVQLIFFNINSAMGSVSLPK